MQRGDKRYRYWNGKLEVHTFLEESIIPGAYSLTWLMKDENGRRYRTTAFTMSPTPLLAYNVWLTDARNSVLNGCDQIEKIQNDISETNEQIREVLAKLNELTVKESVVQ